MTLFLSITKLYKDSLIITIPPLRILSKLFSSFLCFLKSTQNMRVRKHLNLGILQLKEKLSICDRFQYMRNWLKWKCMKKLKIKPSLWQRNKKMKVLIGVKLRNSNQFSNSNQRKKGRLKNSMSKLNSTKTSSKISIYIKCKTISTIFISQKRNLWWMKKITFQGNSQMILTMKWMSQKWILKKFENLWSSKSIPIIVRSLTIYKVKRDLFIITSNGFGCSSHGFPCPSIIIFPNWSKSAWKFQHNICQLISKKD